MKVISFHKTLPTTDPESFLDLNADQPLPGPHDLLVEVRAISVNPLDAKMRAGTGPGQLQGELPILGWDAAGVVREVGTEVTLFKPGDEIYYAGSLDRPGSDAELQCVDERIVGMKPKSLDFAAAAAPDMAEQGRLLKKVAELADAGRIKTTLQTNLGTINAANMRRAHALVESSRTIGKIVLSGFPSSFGISSFSHSFS